MCMPAFWKVLPLHPIGCPPICRVGGCLQDQGGTGRMSKRWDYNLLSPAVGSTTAPCPGLCAVVCVSWGGGGRMGGRGRQGGAARGSLVAGRKGSNCSG